MFANDISRKLIVKFALPLPAVTSQQRGRLIIIAKRVIIYNLLYK